MGKRSRKRGVQVHADPPTAAPAARPRELPDRRARLDELPPAPWAPFPLVELCVLVGLVLMAVGFVAGGDRRAVLILCGVGLAALAGLEQAFREHLAGFRSHSSLLAGALLVATLVVAELLKLPRTVAGAAAIAVGLGAFFLLRRDFARRSGGLRFRA